MTGWRSQRLTCGKRFPFALLTRANQGGTHFVNQGGFCELIEAIVVNLEPVLKTRFLPWLQPGPPEEADRRGKR
jgi:hypothetical protein